MPQLFVVEGAVDLVTGIVAPRPEEGLLLERIRAGRHLRICGSRGSGKTTLLATVAEQLRQSGWRACSVDCSHVRQHLGDADRWPDPLLHEVGKSLDLGALHAVRADQTASQRLREGLLEAAAKGPLLLVLDEFDSMAYPESIEDLAGAPPPAPKHLMDLHAVLRGLMNLRNQDPRARNLTMVLAGVQSPEDLARRVDQRAVAAPSAHIPFESIWIENLPWSEEVYRALAEGFGHAPKNARMELARLVVRASGGHPRVCSNLAERIVAEKLRAPEDLADFVPRQVNYFRVRDSDLFSTVKGYLSGFEAATHHRALEVYRDVLGLEGGRGNHHRYEPDDPAHDLLRWSGVVRVDEPGNLRTRGLFYERYFDVEWTTKRLAELAPKLALPVIRRGEKAAKFRALVINTGGTIGMLPKEGQVQKTADQELVKLYEDLGEICTQVEFESFDPRDSADIGPPYWQKLAEFILSRYRKYDGIVVAHGTDTMAYTASAMAFAFGDRLPFSLVFTGAQTTVDVLHGDARVNLCRALRVAVERIPEVLLVFGEHAFRACQAQKKDDARFDAFESPAARAVADITEFVEVQRDALRTPIGSGRPLSSPFVQFTDGIFQVAQCPATPRWIFEAALDAKDPEGQPLCRAIVLQTLGAGNIPYKEDRYDLTPLIKKAIANDVPVVLSSQFPISNRDLARYRPAAAALSAGAFAIGNMTVAAVVAKLSWALAQVDASIAGGRFLPGDRIRRVNEIMEFNYVGEVNAVSVREASSDTPRLS